MSAYRDDQAPPAECALAHMDWVGNGCASARSRTRGAYDRPVSTYVVRVKPGASRTRVGGSYGDPPALVVAVTEPAVDGRATAAVLRALAAALDVPRTDLEVASGHTSRTKLIRVEAEPADFPLRWAALLRG